MKLNQLEQHSDRWLERLDKAGAEHFEGKRDNQSAAVQAKMSNATARQISENLKVRKNKIAESIAKA